MDNIQLLSLFMSSPLTFYFIFISANKNSLEFYSLKMGWIIYVSFLFTVGNEEYVVPLWKTVTFSLCTS